MPSFDVSSEADLVALKNAVDVAGRHIGNRYDFKGTTARVELNEKDKTLTLFGDSEFQISQIKDILFPEMEKKERESTKRDLLQETIALVKKSIDDFPLQYGNFRD